jgi:SAM-dependent methyltransferase
MEPIVYGAVAEHTATSYHWFMAKIYAFESYCEEYEAWFDTCVWAYRTELDAVRRLLPAEGRCVEIGVGTGRFAGPLGIRVGIEPSAAMRALARKRGVEVVDGVAESLPFRDGEFDCVLFVTAVCFLDSLDEALRETYRILRPGGTVVIGFINRDSPLGKKYEKRKAESRFYKNATFHSVGGVVNRLREAGFRNFALVQAIFTNPADMRGKGPIREGSDEGAFVVVRASRSTRVAAGRGV